MTETSLQWLTSINFREETFYSAMFMTKHASRVTDNMNNVTQITAARNQSEIRSRSEIFKIHFTTLFHLFKVRWRESCNFFELIREMRNTAIM